MPREPLCIGCGQPTGPFPRLNRLSDGRSCPSCRDRLIETLPPIFPSPRRESFEEWADGGEEDPRDDFLEGA
jgi:hypothetical protein